MDSSSRVILNTGAQYARTVINLLLSLISARLILGALGVDDYGIYTLIAGVVSLLSFVINALVVTTQRFLSFHSGRGKPEEVRRMFATSLAVHVLMALFFGVIFELAGFFFFDSLFNIAPDRLAAANVVFHIVTVNVMLSFVTAPFRALLIAHENIVYISIVDVLDAVLRLAVAIALTYSASDRLILYSILLCGISLFNLIVYMAYDFRKYEECVLPRRRYFSAEAVKEMGGFAGWTIYSIFCITGRTQGVAVVINRFFSVAVNAAYGVGMQVNNAIAFLSQSVVNALNPQIMKAEGAGDRKKMLRLSEIESKLCFFLLSMFLVPCLFEMPALLKIWLGNVPEYSVYFCRGLLLASIVDQLTIGLGAANQAIGNIRSYSLTVNTIKFMTIPVVIGLLFLTDDIFVVMTVYVLFELICAVVRLFFLKRTAGLSLGSFFRNVFQKEIIPLAVLVGYCAFIVNLLDFDNRFILTFLTAPPLYILTFLLFGLCDDEKAVVIEKRDLLLARLSPRLHASRRYRYSMGRRIDFKHPKDLNEKILWLSFNTDTTKWSELADKYKVREYVASKGYSGTLTEVYACWNSPEEIDFNGLPESFVLKMNNGSGDAMICRDKASFDEKAALRRFSELFRNRFGLMTAEPHYLRIKPCLIAEQLLDARLQSVPSSSLVDYKIWCFDGRPECVYVTMNRKKDSVEVMTYDLDWVAHPEYSVFSDHYPCASLDVPRPENLDFMLKMATDLAQGFPQVRIDLYEVDGKVYFGEMTFTSNAGMMSYFTPEFLLKAGKKVTLPL